MILKGSQRGGAKNLSVHLMNDRDNDHVTVFELRGFLSRDLHGSLAEMHAISKGTKCEQFMFSLSLNPPKEIIATEQIFLDAANKAEERLGLDGQPRAIVIHEKEGRRHAHVVWSRINHKSMTAINHSHFKLKLNSLSRELYLEHGWELPNGLRRDGGKSPLNFTLAEWQQAKRIKLDPREIKQSFADAWQRSDSVKGFKAALQEKGYFLAKGDRRGYVAVDVNGEVFSVPKWIGIKTKEVSTKLGDPSQFPSVDQTRDHIKSKITDKFHAFMDDVDQKLTDDFNPLNNARAEMVALHRAERTKTIVGQKNRQLKECKTISAKLNTGIRGLWEKLSGSATKIKNQNEHEAWQASKRDQQQRDDLVKAQMHDRKSLQKEIEKLRRKHTQNRRILARDVSQTIRMDDQAERTQSQQRQRSRDRHRGPSL